VFLQEGFCKFRRVKEHSNMLTMKEEIIKLLTKGDYHLKEAKSKFWIRRNEQCEGTCSCCKAIKKYLEAYLHYLLPGLNPIDDFHVLLHTIIQRDPDFKQFYDKIFEVKCFGEEAKRKKENFFLYDDEKNNAINISLEVRNYITGKIKFEKQFLSEYIGTSFMTT
jgi:hypothetical protein